MTARLVLLCALALAAGCGDGDPCDAFPTETCFTLHLDGTIDDGRLDSVSVDVDQGASGIIRRTIAHDPVGLPVSLALRWSASAKPTTSTPRVVVRLGTRAVGSGRANLLDPNMFFAGRHGAAKVMLTPASTSHCFDGRQDNYETDVDCGDGNCPPCERGAKCGECANSTCTNNVCQ